MDSILSVLRLEGSADSIRAGGGKARTDIYAACGAIVISVVVKAVFDVASYAVNVLRNVVSEKEA